MYSRPPLTTYAPQQYAAPYAENRIPVPDLPPSPIRRRSASPPAKAPMAHRRPSPMRRSPRANEGSVVLKTKVPPPPQCPFPAGDPQVEALFELRPMNFSMYDALRHKRPAFAAEFDAAVNRGVVEHLRTFSGLSIAAYDVWTELRPGILSNVVLKYNEELSDLRALLADADWPIRVRVVVRCDADYVDRIVGAVQAIGLRKLGLQEALGLYREWFGRATSGVVMTIVEWDSAETTIDSRAALAGMWTGGGRTLIRVPPPVGTASPMGSVRTR